jgi:small-conductance mechanosensitive channel
MPMALTLRELGLEPGSVALALAVSAAILMGVWAANARLLQGAASLRRRTDRVERPLLALQITLWVLGLGCVLLVVAALAPAVLPVALLGLLLAGSLASVDLLRNLLAGLVLAVRRPFMRGELVVIGDARGVVRRVGLLSVVLEADDASLVEVPTRRVLSEALHHPMPRAGRGVPVSVVFAVPLSTEPSHARKMAMAAAVLSRYAAPRRGPSVTLLPPDEAHPAFRVEVRGAAFDAAHVSAWRDDVTDLYRDAVLSAGPPTHE